MKSSPSIWHYLVHVKSTVKISSISEAFLENMSFKSNTTDIIIKLLNFYFFSKESLPNGFR